MLEDRDSHHWFFILNLNLREMQLVAKYFLETLFVRPTFGSHVFAIISKSKDLYLFAFGFSIWETIL